METDRTPTTLLQRCRDAGDSDAWREFESRYAPLVIGYCLSRGVQLTDAEDVRQSVMLSLSRTLPVFEYDRTRGRFRDYLGRTVRHALARHQRHAAGRRAALAAAPRDDPAVESDAAWEREWATHHLRLALEGLRRTHSARDVAVFEMLLAGVPSHRVGEAHGLTAPAVRKIAQRLRARLRELLDESVQREDRGDDTGRSS